MNFLYCDAALVSHMGHNANYCFSITHEVRRRGAEVMILAPHAARDSLVARLGAVRHFRIGNPCQYEQLWRDPLCGYLKNFEIGSEITAQDLALVGGLRSGDVVFVTCAHPFQLMACITWAQGSFQPGTCPSFIFEFNALPLVEKGPGPESEETHLGQYAVPALFRLALSHLHPDYVPHFRFIAATEPFARIHGKVIGRRVEAVPMPQGAVLPPRQRGRGDSLTLSFLGSQAEYKGFGLVPELATRLLALRPRLRFLVHNCAFRALPATVGELRRLASREERVEYLDGGDDYDGWQAWIESMDDARWNRLLDRADLVVLPYHHACYADTPSGIAAEAMAHGIPLVAPRHTATGDLMESFGRPGVLFDANTLEEVMAAILEAVDDYDGVAARAGRARQLWAERMGVARFVDAILAPCPPAGEERPASGERHP